MCGRCAKRALRQVAASGSACSQPATVSVAHLFGHDHRHDHRKALLCRRKLISEQSACNQTAAQSAALAVIFALRYAAAAATAADDDDDGDIQNKQQHYVRRKHAFLVVVNSSLCTYMCSAPRQQQRDAPQLHVRCTPSRRFRIHFPVDFVAIFHRC